MPEAMIYIPRRLVYNGPDGKARSRSPTDHPMQDP